MTGEIRLQQGRRFSASNRNMVARFRLFLFCLLSLSCLTAARADARFDLVGPRIDVTVTRDGVTLPIAEVPNLQPGDKLWLHADLPKTQSVHYLLLCIFLRGTTNPPPPDWFFRMETWNKKVQEEGAFVTVPAEAEQAVLLMAPETGGDFSTIKSAVEGKPGLFVRAAQDLVQAGFEQQRIEKYLVSIRRVPPSEAKELQKHSDLLARTLNLKPNAECFKQPVDTQFTCLTQAGAQTLLDDGHGQSMLATLSNGPSSDLINAASYTGVAGGGVYSAYVGAVVDLARLLANLHTAKYQYIPAIGFPQGQQLNLRLNTPPSFVNPKSVLVIGLPPVQKAVLPPLRTADATFVACLMKPAATLPIEGAPLVFSTGYAHDLVLHLETPSGVDIPLVADAFQGGLVLQKAEEDAPKRELLADAKGSAVVEEKPKDSGEESVLAKATIRGRWGFDAFVGPTVTLQRRPGTDWHIVSAAEDENANLIAGKGATVMLASTGSACVHTLHAQTAGSPEEAPLTFKPSAKGAASLLEVTLPAQQKVQPGNLRLSILQYGQPKADEVTTKTFAEPAHISGVEMHAGDRMLTLTGSNLTQVAKVQVGDLAFVPGDATSGTTLRLQLAADAPAPPTKAQDKLTAGVTLRDGRVMKQAVTVLPQRPSLKLLRKNAEAGDGMFTLTNADDLPLKQKLSFTLKTEAPFPRNAQIEIATLDGTLRTVLTLAPSGGLLLQDPRTIVATLDPLRSFGPSAFGEVHLRAVYPAADASSEPAQTSDWTPLATLVRLPTLTSLQCPAELGKPCTVTGENLFLIQELSTDENFGDPTVVPDGFIGNTLSVGGSSTGKIYLKLRDDAASTVVASVPAAVKSDTGHAASAK